MRKSILLVLLMALVSRTPAQEEVPINDVDIDATGRIQIQVTSSPEHYYVLHRRFSPDEDAGQAVSLTLGQEGSTTLTESLGAHGPNELYRVTEYRQDAPGDTDGDGIDDMTEMLNPVRLSPLNPAPAVALIDGAVSIPDRETFKELSYQGLDVLIDAHLEDLEFVKFYIIDSDTDHPQVYFMNTNTHRAHRSFATAVGLDGGGGAPADGNAGGGNAGGGGRVGGGGAAGGRGGGGLIVPGQMRGELVYHPHVDAPNGETGLYRFEFEPRDAYPFAAVQMAYELLAANMPVLRNNFAYYPMPEAALPRYWQEKELYDASRVMILLEEAIYANVNYLPLNLAEGYGLLRMMSPNERPHSRDIVIYEALPNEMPRVGGIITSVPQTPLSHVNLRAIQDNVPNAYIRGALENETISALIGKHVYFRVDVNGYEIREATLAEVEAHYVDLRPTEPQIPIRDLSVTDITPLDAMTFEQSSSFGVKAANLATLRTLGFPEGTIPNGFGVPFYFYDEFMKHNGFYEQVAALLEVPEFQQDYDVQERLLSEFRKTLRAGDMPDWMWDALTELQNAFPEGRSIRCRSSTNNEDLPGFSGAGLYTSKTQHPHEGHISKSIKQVFAGLWNFRAFDERQFYRIDHFAAAMGVLVHPNYSDELANGVGVTKDPIYGTEGSYYLNTQIGEDLVTNPEALSIPEEILLPASGPNYTLVRPSNLVADGEQILSRTHIRELQSYLGTIHSVFHGLYNIRRDSDFAMEIEYKITSEGQLAIKQARPWVD